MVFGFELRRYPAHERSSRVAETGITSSTIESGAEHVIGQPVKRKEQRTLPALFRRHQRQLDLLQRIRCMENQKPKTKRKRRRRKTKILYD